MEELVRLGADPHSSGHSSETGCSIRLKQTMFQQVLARVIEPQFERPNIDPRAAEIAIKGLPGAALWSRLKRVACGGRGVAHRDGRSPVRNTYQRCRIIMDDVGEATKNTKTYTQTKSRHQRC
jgi:hypothetical protein